MSKIAKPLTAAAVAKLRTPGRYAVGGVDGLHLRITPAGTRLWVLRMVVDGKRRDIGLGRYEDVTLSQARDVAQNKRHGVRTGLDIFPAAAVPTTAHLFRDAAAELVTSKASGWKNEKHRAQWAATLATYADPVLGNMDVGLIELSHILRVLQPIWTEKTETATRVRGRIEAVLDYATVQGWRHGDNPARWKGLLDKVLPAPGKVTIPEHMRAMPIDETPGFFQGLAGVKGTAALALRLLILTAARAGEIRGAQWSEFDLGAAIWTVPAERMKAGQEHRVPLSTAAVRLLGVIPRLGSLLFPNAKSTAGHEAPISDMAMTVMLRKRGLDYVPHGFRSTFRDWAGDRTEFPRDVIEMALAHTITSKVEAAYRRSDALEKRRPLMQRWADFLESTPRAATSPNLPRATRPNVARS